MNINLTIELLEEYQRLLQQEKDYINFQKENPGEFYRGERPSVSELKRAGIMVRKLMIDIERYLNNYEFMEGLFR